MKRLLIASLLLNAALLGYGAWRLADGAETPSSPDADWLWAARVSLFETLPPADGGDVFLGASIIQYGAWDELVGDPPVLDRVLDRALNRVLNRGIRGDTTAGVLARLSASVKGRPDRVFVMVGLNDLSRGVTLDELSANYAAILETLRAQSPEAEILFFSLLPVRRPGSRGQALNVRILEANALLADLLTSSDGTYLDVHGDFLGSDGQLRDELTTDGVHLTGAGYAILRNHVAQLSQR